MATRTKLTSPQKAKKFFEAKLSFTTGPAELKELIDSGKPPIIVDVRAAKDFEEGHIPSAVNLPEDQWRSLKGLSKRKQHVVYCYSVVCHLAARAAHFFAGKGYPVMELDGGIESWTEYGYELEKPQETKIGAQQQAAEEKKVA